MAGHTDGLGRVRVVVLTCCALVLAYYVVVLQIDTYRGVRLTWDHVTTDARVTAVGPASGSRGGDSPAKVWADLAFATADGRTVTARIFVGTDRTPAVGDELPIDYLPSHPQTVREAGRFWSDDVQSAALLLGLLGLPTLAGAGWLTWWLVRSSRRRPRA